MTPIQKERMERSMDQLLSSKKDAYEKGYKDALTSLKPIVLQLKHYQEYNLRTCINSTIYNDTVRVLLQCVGD